MEQPYLFHKRPMAGVAMGTLLAVLAHVILPTSAALIVAAACLAGGAVLLFRRLPFAALLLAFFAVTLRMTVSAADLALPSAGWLAEGIAYLRGCSEHALDALFGNLSGLAKGILLGDKQDIFYPQLMQYQRAGLAHILAVSGLHVTILCGALNALLRGIRAWIRLLICTVFLLLYGALTGFSPSMCRAALMFLCWLLARALGERADSLSAFCLAFSVILTVSPSAVFSVSFQLSFAAIFGLLMLPRSVCRWLRLPKGVETGAVAPLSAVAATLGTLPVSAYYFGVFSAVGVLLSPLVIPLLPLFMIPAFLAILLYYAMPGAASALALLPRGFLIALNQVIEWTDRTPVRLSAPSLPVIALFYLSLLLLSPYYLPNQKRPPYAGMAVACCTVILWIIS